MPRISLCVALAALAAPARAQVPALLPVLRPAFSTTPPSQAGVPVPPAPGLAARVFTLVPSSPARAAAERAFLDGLAALLESTREGRRILSELEAGGTRIPVSFRNWLRETDDIRTWLIVRHGDYQHNSSSTRMPRRWEQDDSRTKSGGV